MATTNLEQTVFIARGQNLILGRCATHETIAQGRKVPVPKTGLIYPFEGGRLIVDSQMIERDRDYFDRNPEDFKVAFGSSVYEPPSIDWDPQDPDRHPQTLEWLQGHDLLGDRFYELPLEVPSPTVELQVITMAAAKQDAAKIVEVLELELATWNRPEVIAQGQMALEALKEPAGTT